MAETRDTWLYGTKRQRKAVQKAAISERGQLEPASDATHRHLTEDPRERATAARLVHFGGRSSELVSVLKAKGDEPPPSRQLRDPFTAFYVQGVALEPPLPPERLLNLTEENVIHSACLDAKATDACGRGWSFAPKDGKEADESLVHSEEPEQLRQQMEDLTPDLTFTELLKQAEWEMDAIGWGVWEVVREKAAVGTYGAPAAIYPIPSHTIRASLDPRKWVQMRAGRVRYFKKFGAPCTVNNETGDVLDWDSKRGKAAAAVVPQEYVASELIIFKEYTPRSLWYGLPKWISNVSTIAELGAIREFNVSWFASGGQIDYHMHFKAGSLEMAKEMKGQVETQVRENAGRGHTGILTAGDQDTEVAVQKLGDMLREGHFRFRRGDLVKEVLIAHGVPPYRIGWAETGSLGGSSSGDMLDAYGKGVVKPRQQVIEDRLRMTLFDPKTGIKTGDFRLKLAELDLSDLMEEMKVAESSVEKAIMTPNQARKHIGMDPDDGHPEMDEYYYGGQKLGEKPPDPFGGQPGAPGSEEAGFFGEDPEAEAETGAPSFGAPPFGRPPAGKAPPLAVPKRKGVDAARAMVVDMLRGYEAALKAALEDESPAPKRKRAKS